MLLQQEALPAVLHHGGRHPLYDDQPGKGEGKDRVHIPAAHVDEEEEETRQKPSHTMRAAVHEKPPSQEKHQQRRRSGRVSAKFKEVILTLIPRLAEL